MQKLPSYFKIGYPFVCQANVISRFTWTYTCHPLYFSSFENAALFVHVFVCVRFVCDGGRRVGMGVIRTNTFPDYKDSVSQIRYIRKRFSVRTVKFSVHDCLPCNLMAFKKCMRNKLDKQRDGAYIHTYSALHYTFNQFVEVVDCIELIGFLRCGSIVYQIFTIMIAIASGEAIYDNNLLYKSCLSKFTGGVGSFLCVCVCAIATVSSYYYAFFCFYSLSIKRFMLFLHDSLCICRPHPSVLRIMYNFTRNTL